MANFPALAALLVITLANYFDDAQLCDDAGGPGPPAWLTRAGEHVLPARAAGADRANSGWIVVTLVLAAIGAALIDHKYRAATVWAVCGTVLTLIGAMHAYRLDGNVIREYFLWQTSAAPTVAYRAVSDRRRLWAGGTAVRIGSVARGGLGRPCRAYRDYPSKTELPVAEMATGRRRTLRHQAAPERQPGVVSDRCDRQQQARRACSASW